MAPPSPRGIRRQLHGVRFLLVGAARMDQPLRSPISYGWPRTKGYFAAGRMLSLLSRWRKGGGRAEKRDAIGDTSVNSRISPIITPEMRPMTEMNDVGMRYSLGGGFGPPCRSRTYPEFHPALLRTPPLPGIPETVSPLPPECQRNI